MKVPKKDVGLVSVLNKTEYDKQKFRFEGKLTEKSAISLNLWIKEFERLAKKNRMKPVDFIKKHISKRKGMDNQVVKDVLKHFQKKESVNEAVEPRGNIKKVLDVAKNKQAKNTQSRMRTYICFFFEKYVDIQKTYKNKTINDSFDLSGLKTLVI